MDIEIYREHCLKKKGVTEGFPFDETTLVFKVMGKMFALISLEPPHIINLKCDPERAIELREEYSFVREGYHMSKIHWNTVDLPDVTKPNLVKEWIDDSYDLIVAGLTKKKKEELKNL